MVDAVNTQSLQDMKISHERFEMAGLVVFMCPEQKRNSEQVVVWQQQIEGLKYPEDSAGKRNLTALKPPI